MATSRGLSPVQSIEAFHLAFLQILQVRLNQDSYVLKGGANLRFFYGSPRYSEDMDLDTASADKATLEDRVDGVLNSRPLSFILQAQGLKLSAISKHKQTETTQRWKVALLQENAGRTFPTKIEFSRRQVDPRHDLAQVPPAIVEPYSMRPPTVRHYLAEAAIEQKIYALSMRAETQARDVFDLDLLFRANPDLPHHGSLSAAVTSTAIERTLELPYEAYRTQVLAFLDPEVVELYERRESWDQMQQSIIDRLSRPA